jgi:hypothetical protein
MPSISSEGWARARLWVAMAVALLSLVALGLAIRSAGVGRDGRSMRRLRLQARLELATLHLRDVIANGRSGGREERGVSRCTCDRGTLS